MPSRLAGQLGAVLIGVGGVAIICRGLPGPFASEWLFYFGIAGIVIGITILAGLVMLTQKPSVGDPTSVEPQPAGPIPWTLWLLFPFALVLFGYGVVCIVKQQGYLVGRGGTLELHGIDAIALGFAYCIVGAFVTASPFVRKWMSPERSRRVIVVGLLAVIASMTFVIVRYSALKGR